MVANGIILLCYVEFFGKEDAWMELGRFTLLLRPDGPHAGCRSIHMNHKRLIRIN